MDSENTRQTWNKKRIFAALFLLILLGIGTYFFKTKILPSESPKSVKGVSLKKDKSPMPTTNETKIDIQKAFKEKIEELKQEVANLNVLDIASSSPQVQKILNDIKGLEQYPKNQFQDICKQICGL